MKRSIKHLPKRTQEELNFLLELVVQKIKGCKMIILYGSYARGVMFYGMKGLNLGFVLHFRVTWIF